MNVKHRRRSGVLLHITSLPSEFGTGDMGPCADNFTEFLSEAGFSAWQVLPLTPTEPIMGNSPYSGSSAFAGNRLIISPELLVRDGLLRSADIEPHRRVSFGGTDFKRALEVRSLLLEKAWLNFCGAADFGSLNGDFEAFRKREAHWLHDFALFSALKKKFPDKSWKNWPKPYKFRDEDTLSEFLSEPENREEYDFVSFVQFIFAKQWNRVRSLCSERGIELIGDMPIYVSEDSSDVWAAPELFELDGEGDPVRVAGVPPDYFSEDGQKWGNPLYRWDRMESDGFSWWKRRLGSALEQFDCVRIDHFRGFCGYWAVPAEAETARSGEWEPAPGRKLLNDLTSEAETNGLERLPLIAEDLGIITEDVRELMDEFGLPGMKVLLFAFEGGRADGAYAPHNHGVNSVAYTGTHDNNTARGWWEEASEAERELLSAYFGAKVGSENVHIVMTRLALASPARLAVVPAQDLLGLDGNSRMNTPGQACGSWGWRLKADGMKELSELAPKLRRLNEVYGRCPQ